MSGRLVPGVGPWAGSRGGFSREYANTRIREYANTRIREYANTRIREDDTGPSSGRRWGLAFSRGGFSRRDAETQRRREAEKRRIHNPKAWSSRCGFGDREHRLASMLAGVDVKEEEERARLTIRHHPGTRQHLRRPRHQVSEMNEQVDAEEGAEDAVLTASPMATRGYVAGARSKGGWRLRL
jgi:hypothetical protein